MITDDDLKHFESREFMKGIPDDGREWAIRAMVSEIRRLRAALAEYANAENWKKSEYQAPRDWWQPMTNGYDLAREVLADVP